MANNKVVLGDETLIDLTEDTVTEDNLLAGVTAHNAAGEKIEGVVVVATIDTALSETSENPVQNKVVTQAISNKIESEVVTELSPEDIPDYPPTLDDVLNEIDGLKADKANNSIISDAWSASVTYAVGQYCIYNNVLWKCKVANNGQTPAEGTYWTKVSVSSEFGILNSSLSDVNASLSDVNASLSWKYLGRVQSGSVLNVPSNYNELEILMMYGDFRNAARVSKQTFQNITDKKLMYSFRYWYNGFHLLEFAFVVTSKGIYYSRVTLDDSVITADYLTDIYYR